jgi:hypothetical protein
MPEKIDAAETAKFMKGKPGNIQEYRREAAETEGGCPLLFHCATGQGLLAGEGDAGVPVRYVEETEQEKPRRTRGSADAAGIHEDSRAKATCRG